LEGADSVQGSQEKARQKVSNVSSVVFSSRNCSNKLTSEKFWQQPIWYKTLKDEKFSKVSLLLNLLYAMTIEQTFENLFLCVAGANSV